MPTETLTKNERAVRQAFSGIGEPQRKDARRTRALERIYRLRAFTVHLIVFAVGLPIIGAIWVLTEYFEEHTWPDRFASAPDVAGTWDPWFFFVAGIWAIILVAHGLRAYFGPPVGPIQRYIQRPVTDAQINRAIQRMRHEVRSGKEV